LYFLISKILSPLVNFSNFIFLGVIVFIILYRFFKKEIFKNFLVIFSLIFFISCIFPLGKHALRYLEKDYVNKEQFIDYDNIIVLAGAEQTSTTNYTKTLNLNESSERLILSVDLALKNKDSKIIFLGGSGNLSKNKLNEVDVAKIFYKNVGFDLNRIKFIGDTRNTIENLKKFKNLNINKDNDLLITSAFHMNRAMMISKKIGLNLNPYAVDFRGSVGNEKLINTYQSFDISHNLYNLNVFMREILGIFVAKIIL